MNAMDRALIHARQAADELREVADQIEEVFPDGHSDLDFVAVQVLPSLESMIRRWADEKARWT